MRKVLKISAGTILITIGLIGLLMPIMPGWVFVFPGVMMVFPERGKIIIAWIKSKIEVIVPRSIKSENDLGKL